MRLVQNQIAIQQNMIPMMCMIMMLRMNLLLISQKTTGNNSKRNSAPQSRGGISTFGAIVAVIGRLFLGVGIVVLFGGGEDTPALITIILWVVCATVLSVWFENIGL